MSTIVLVSLTLLGTGIPRLAGHVETRAEPLHRSDSIGVSRTADRPELLLPEARLTATGKFAGSNGGQWLREESGALWFGKPSKGDGLQLDRQANEQAMNDIYRLAGGAFGIVAPETRLATVNGQTTFLSKKLESPIVETAPTEDARNRFADGFVIDAWLGNWDIGARHQLVVTADGSMPRIDNGGAGLFRARGEPKNDRFGTTVGELESMRNPAMISGYSFARLSPTQVQAQIDKFAAWYPGHASAVAAAVDRAPLSPALKTELRTKLQARAAWLISRATVRAVENP